MSLIAQQLIQTVASEMMQVLEFFTHREARIDLLQGVKQYARHLYLFYFSLQLSVVVAQWKAVFVMCAHHPN